MTRKALLVVLVSTVLAACSWGQYRAGPAHTGVQPFESTIGVANVGSLTSSWTYSGTAVSSAVVGGTVYTGGPNTLVALDAAGNTNCAGSPRTCTPEWTASVPTGVRGAPAVVDGVVYVGSTDGAHGWVTAFDAAGVRNCTGAPKACTPLWRGAVGGVLNASPTVAAGVVFVGAGDDLVAFAAAGCGTGPGDCAPLWTAHTADQVMASPSVADGMVFASSWDHQLYAFDAAGNTGCSGMPKVCTPLWSATTVGPIDASPTVAGGVVYVGSNNSISQVGEFYAFDAHGVTGCAGAPKVCAPLWTAALDVGVGEAAATSNTVYVQADGRVFAFDAHGVTGCSGSPTTCTPQWATTQEFGTDGPIVANGVLYVANASDLRAFDAAGSTSCSGSPKVCSAIWTSPAIGGIGVFDPVVVNGDLFVSTATGTFHAFGLPG